MVSSGSSLVLRVRSRLDVQQEAFCEASLEPLGNTGGGGGQERSRDFNVCVCVCVRPPAAVCAADPVRADKGGPVFRGPAGLLAAGAAVRYRHLQDQGRCCYLGGQRIIAITV